MAHALRYLVAAWVIAAASAWCAQPVPPDQAVRFTVFSTRPAGGLAFVPRVGAASVPLVFYPTARSPHYEYRGAMPLRFTDAKSGEPVAEANVPPAISTALLLLVPLEPAPSKGLRYQVYVLDDTAARQAPGSLAIINLSGLALSGMLDGNALTLQPGLNPVQPVGRSAHVLLRTTFKSRSYQAYAGTVELGKNERALLLLLPPFYKGSLEVQSRLLLDAPSPRPAARTSP